MKNKPSVRSVRDPQDMRSLPEEYRRVLISTRILPDTIRYLESLGRDNLGRAIDLLVQAARNRSMIVESRNNPGKPIKMIPIEH